MICCSLESSTIDGLLMGMIRAKNVSSFVELRLDSLSSYAKEDIVRLFSKKTSPVIITCRKKEEGGKFRGSEDERIQLLIDCIALGADYVDIELSSGKDAIEQLKKERKSAKIIVSYHDFSGFPKNLDSIYSMLKDSQADIIKIACMATSLSENLSMLSLLEKSKKEGIQMIGICMGALGEISRILGPAFGSFCTFGSLEPESETAPGQITCEYLKRVYRADQLKKEGLLIFGLLGNPVSKSKGYILHNLLFKELGMNAVYLNFHVSDLFSFISSFRSYVKGLSITMPYKEKIIPLLDTIDETAKKIGAVNTIIVRQGKLFGSNTDVSGAMKSLEEKTKIEGKNVVIIGSGGAARAIAFGIVQKKGILCIVNRTLEKAKHLANELGCQYSLIHDIDWKKVDILINASSVGMAPKTNESPIDGRLLRNMIVFDAIYNPLITKLLSDAERNKCTIISGVQMFIHQAHDQFKLWTGKEADIDFLEESVLQYVVND